MTKTIFLVGIGTLAIFAMILLPFTPEVD